MEDKNKTFLASAETTHSTDSASDDYWSAILLKRIDGLDHFCAYGSGQFKDSEKNYHVIYKEVEVWVKG